MSLNSAAYRQILVGDLPMNAPNMTWIYFDASIGQRLQPSLSLPYTLIIIIIWRAIVIPRKFIHLLDERKQLRQLSLSTWNDHVTHMNIYLQKYGDVSRFRDKSRFTGTHDMSHVVSVDAA